MGGGNRRLQVASIDDLPTHHHIEKLPGTQVSDQLTRARRAEVLMAGEQPNSPCLCQPHGHIGEVRAHLLARRSFVVPRVLTALVDAIPTKR